MAMGPVFTEKRLREIAYKLLKAIDEETVVRKPAVAEPVRKYRAEKKEPAQAANPPDAIFAELLEKGKKAGKLFPKDLECLDEMNLDSEVIDKFFESLEDAGVVIDIFSEDMHPPIGMVTEEEIKEDILTELFEQGKEAGKLACSDLKCLDEMNLTEKAADSFYWKLERTGVRLYVPELEDQPLGSFGRRRAAVPPFYKVSQEEINALDSLSAGLDADDPVRIYLNEIAEVPLLSPEEEQELIKRIAAGDEEAKERILDANLSMVVAAVRHYMDRGIGLPELIQEGNAGLIKAVEKFDCEKGCKFSTYATWCVRRYLKNLFSSTCDIESPAGYELEIIMRRCQLQQELGRIPTAEEIADGTSYSAEFVRLVVPDVRELPPDPFSNNSSAYESPLTKQLKAVIDVLTPSERRAVALHLGIADGRRWSLEEIAAEFNTGLDCIRRFKSIIIRKLRRRCGEELFSVLESEYKKLGTVQADSEV